MSGARLALKAVAFGAMVSLLPLGVATGQRAPQRTPTFVTTITAEGNGPDFDTRTLDRGFNLFSSADAAFSGMRATGNYGTAITNYGDCDGTLRNCQGNSINVSGTNRAPYFEVEWVYGVPPSQFVKIRSAAPSVANAGGGGWMAAYNRTVLGTPRRFGPHDGTLGSVFSGATSTADGSCRDHQGQQNGFYGAGLQILAASDCSETWGSAGWQGSHPIDAEGWKAVFDAQGSNFAFDFWRVPLANQRLDKPFLGTRHHTYGETSDYMADILRNYGSVVPGGTGNPVYQGYPLGIHIRFEAFNFAVPTVADAYFVQAVIVNRSEDLWGAPIDYDSLYFGLSQGTLFSDQSNSRYAMPEMGMVVYHQNNVGGATGPCADASRQPYPGWTCLGASSTTRGYRAGATGLIFLKTPIGDLRNKLFTRTTAGTPCTVGLDPFCMPSHPLAGDTLTFNRQAFGDYGGADAATWLTNTQASFGYLAGMEDNTLAGRSITDFNERTQYSTFRSEFWPANKAHHNKYVPPGNWDYNKDGVLDTLALDTCGQFGCAGVDSDTMPGGWLNRRGNIGGLQSFGPISLKAGDSTSVIYAHVGSADSANFWAQVNAVVDLYLNFYLSPESPPAAQVVSTQVVPGTDQFGTINPEVTLFYSDDPERWVDPFLMKLASDVESSPAFTDLLTLNPDLPDSLRSRAANNFEQLEVYKSCDGGDSFTADSDCDGDPAVQVDGTSDVFGWQAYATIPADEDGAIPNSYEDGNVDGGRTYLYVLIGKSRGAVFLLNTPTGPDTIVFSPSIRNPLSRSTSDPNVSAVYVPASKPAGYVAASVAFTSATTASVPFELALSDAVETASYRAVFGHEILVARDSNTATNEVTQSVVTIRRRQTVDVAGVAVDSVLRSESFTYASPLTFLVEGTGTAAGSVTVGAIRTTTTRYGAANTGLGFVLARADGTPIFGSTTLTADNATPAELLSREEYPGFVIDADQTVQGTHNQDAEAQVRGQQSLDEQNLLITDTLVPRGLVNSFMVQWRETSALRPNTVDGVGVYEATWAADPFGVERGFIINKTNPAATEAEVRATLAARALPTTGLTDAATAALLGVDQSDLVPVKAPFTVRNVTFNRDVSVAMVRRISNRLLLGNGVDTISVEVQEDQWIPGDRLYFIEDIVEDSTALPFPAGTGGVVVDAGSGQVVQRTRRAATFTQAVFGCNSVREPCNPVVQTTPGATGYDPFRAGDVTRWEYYVGFKSTTEYAFDVVAATTGGAITAVTDSALGLIRVVPNPYVIYSQYQESAADGRLMFTNLPAQGTLRIYTVSGQFVQQVTWEPSDLEGEGDLFWDMRTREGIDIASGLYLWVVTTNSNPTDATSAGMQARGKFVVIRGDSR
jgi:hypothetical protein